MKTICITIACIAFYATAQLPTGNLYETYIAPEAAQAGPAHVAARYSRGITELQKQPCRPDWNRDHYKSEIIGKPETIAALKQAGFSDHDANIFAAISHAESGSQLNCYGDDYGNYMKGKWGPSYGLFQIRTLDASTGKGDCRDIERLRENLLEQSKCAYEISNGGRNIKPWSVTHAKRGRPYLKWVNANW